MQSKLIYKYILSILKCGKIKIRTTEIAIKTTNYLEYIYFQQNEALLNEIVVDLGS